MMMFGDVFEAVMLACMLLLTLSIGVALLLMFKKESTIPECVLLIDSFSYIIIGLIAIISIVTDSDAYVESILLIGILAFLSTIALSRFMERGVVIERKRDR